MSGPIYCTKHHQYFSPGAGNQCPKCNPPIQGASPTPWPHTPDGQKLLAELDTACEANDRLSDAEKEKAMGEGPTATAPAPLDRENLRDLLYGMRNVLDGLSWYSGKLQEIRNAGNRVLLEMHRALGIGYEASGRSSIEPPVPAPAPRVCRHGVTHYPGNGCGICAAEYQPAPAAPLAPAPVGIKVLMDLPNRWEEVAMQYARNTEYYSGLLDECAKHLGAAVYVSDDGSIQDRPIRAKIPELVAKLAAPSLDGSMGATAPAHGAPVPGTRIMEFQGDRLAFSVSSSGALGIETKVMLGHKFASAYLDSSEVADLQAFLSKQFPAPSLDGSMGATAPVRVCRDCGRTEDNHNVRHMFTPVEFRKGEAPKGINPPSPSRDMGGSK